MASIPEPPWGPSPELWDRLTVDDVECPGLASVSVSRANKWDTKKAQGSHGGERNFKGADLATVKAQVRIWTLEQHEAFVADILPLIEPRPGKESPKALSLGHGVTTARNVASVTIDNVSGPEADPVGFVVYDIDATEYREPEKAKGSGKPSTGGKCAELDSRYALSAAQWATWNALYNVAMNPIGGAFDPVAAQQYLGLMRVEEGNQAAINLERQARGCNTAHPFPPEDHEAAEKILAA